MRNSVPVSKPKQEKRCKSSTAVATHSRGGGERFQRDFVLFYTAEDLKAYAFKSSSAVATHILNISTARGAADISKKSQKHLFKLVVFKIICHI
jgi:hypothetical protein